MATTTCKTPAEGRKLLPRFTEHPLLALREEVDDLFSRLVSAGEDGWFSARLSPSLDLIETDNALEVRMDVPGVKAEELDIRINHQTLTVSGERKVEKEEKGRTYYRSERRAGCFSRTVTLPCPVDEGKVDAKCNDGVLTITLPKTTEAKAHKIKVKSGSA